MSRKSHKPVTDLHGETLGIRLSVTERHRLSALSALLQRTQSDTVRWLISESSRAYSVQQDNIATDRPLAGQGTEQAEEVRYEPQAD